MTILYIKNALTLQDDFSGPPIAQLQDDGEDVETKVEDDIPANNEDVPIEEGSEQVPEISRATTTITKSDCPIENGVVYTQWGAIQAGTVIAGIASGLERQEITVANEAGTYVVDSRYAVTLAGKFRAIICTLLGVKLTGPCEALCFCPV